MLFQEESSALFADIIIPLNLPQTLTYGVPVDMHSQVRPGVRVEVALGNNKQYAGIVAAVHTHKPEAFDVKPIRAILDDAPILTPQQLKLWQWIGHYYLAAPGEVMQAALPAHLKLMGETRVQWAPARSFSIHLLSPQGQAAALILRERGAITIADLRGAIGRQHLIGVLGELLEHEAILLNDALEPAYKPRREKIMAIDPVYTADSQKMQQLFMDLERAPKQLAILIAYLAEARHGEALPQAPVLAAAGSTATQLKSLADKGIFIVDERDADRVAPAPYEGEPAAIEFTPAQAKAYDDMQAGLAEKGVVLLQGVTGSGKTLLYIQKIREVIAEGKQALLLLPEIGLTTQLVSRLRRYFGDELGIYHSRFSNNERVEIWDKVQRRQYHVVVGPRSALWLPFQDLGVVIIDEEHDPSYKQRDPAPRFHARDAAIYYARLHKAGVVLGSATPAVETMYNVQQKKYAFAGLKERYQGIKMPGIEIVDARSLERARKQGFQLLTPELQTAMAEALTNKKQIILFQNRRGYAPFQICQGCGWVPQCPNCAVSLTYHKSTDRLQCHYCGSVKPVLNICPQCGGNRITSRSFGTEKIEEEVKLAFPEARVARMDLDSMRGKQALSNLLEDLDARRVDILVGTQMVVKGLDFKPVTLVGVLSSDSLLSYPDFRVNERAFQLMEQVAGRAGRGDGEGRVIIQAYQMDHPVLHWVVNHDVRAFYRHEIGYREFFHFPPFVRIIKIICRHKEEQQAHDAAAAMVQGIISMLENPTAATPEARLVQIQGPVPAVVPRIRNQWVSEVWIKLPRTLSLIERVKATLKEQRQIVGMQKPFRDAQIIFDVDPA